MSGSFSGYQVTTWFLVVAGWLIVNHTSNGRELRKEARSACDAAKKLAASIGVNSISYFTSDKNELAYEIKSEFELLEIELERIKRFQGSSLFRAFVNFQEACTSGDFESSARVQHSKNSKQVLDVVRCRNLVFQEIERKFSLEYCKFWARWNSKLPGKTF